MCSIIVYKFRRVIILKAITWDDLLLVAFFVVFILLIAVLFYFIRFLISIGQSADVLKRVLKKNEENIDSTLNHIPKITGEVAEMAKTTKFQVNSFNEVIAAFSDTTNGALNKVKSVYDIIYLLVKVFFFFYNRKKNSENIKS